MPDEDDPSSLRAGPTKAFTNISLLNSQGGIRDTTKTPRGVYIAKDELPTPESTLWLEHIEQKLLYRFQNPDLLEEALETPGSGVVCVGQSCRACADGNKGLARIGEGVSKAVVEDGCYLYKYHPEDIDATIKSLLGLSSLHTLGNDTGIQKFIRPKAPLRESQAKNPIKKMLANMGGENKKKVVARGMKAVIGAVYYDGGFEEARRVLVGLGLVPKPVEN